MGLRIAILVSKLSAREMESDSDGSDREERPRTAASKRNKKHDPWRAVARQLRVGACAVSMGDVLGAARRAVRRRLKQAGCA